MVFDGKDTGAEANVLSKTGTGTYDLTLSGILSSGNVSVSVSKDGYDIANNEKEISVYFYEATITDVYGDFEYSYGAIMRKVTITKYSGPGGEVVIPATINTMPVTTIADGYHNPYNWNEITGVFLEKNITGVTIPSSITHIGDYAFCYNQLTSVIIPNSVVTIGNWAFAGNQLDRVIIPNSVVSLGEIAFSDNNLTYISISSKLTVLEYGVFGNNILTSVVIPSNIVEIRNNVFRGKSYPGIHDPFVYLSSITIGENVLLDVSAFADSNYLYENGVYFNTFFEYYNSNGKKAGTYIRPDPDSKEWVRQANLN
jgi:hypothetical protein